MEIKGEAGMIKPTTISIGRTINATSVVRRDIQNPTSPRLKKINKEADSNLSDSEYEDEA